jgi:signal transduction histidine kinase
MRRRLIVLLALLMGCALLALSVPFGRSLAAARQQEMFVDRLQDTSRFAAAAAQATTSVALGSLRNDLARYGELYGITVAVVGRDAVTTWAVAGPSGELTRSDVAERIRQAAAGHQSTAPPTIWPWLDRPIIVAVPVVRGDNVVAVAVTVSDTGRLRFGVGRDLALVAAVDIVAMVLLAAVAARLAHWILRPVYVLDVAARRISSGDLTARVSGATGPVELRQLSATFNGMAQAVDLAMQRQESFVADASHQLRNPLAALMLRLDALAMGLDEQRREQLRFAREEAGRLGAILDELLELATALHVAARPTMTNIHTLVEARLASWRPLAERSQVTLAGDADPIGTPVVHALVDPVLISSALDAVLDNAVKFTPAGGRVDVHVHETDAEVQIEVVDTGPGLSEADLHQIGNRFWRSATSQNVPGSGLGLSIARTLLATSGGELAFAAATPHGLRVTLRLPRDGAENRTEPKTEDGCA